MKVITVDQDIFDFLASRASSPAEPPLPSPSPSVVVFHIPSGWIEKLERRVEHRGGDGRPFPHPANDIFPADSADFVLQTTYNPDAEGPLTDHDQGPTAQFWIRVAARQ